VPAAVPSPVVAPGGSVEAGDPLPGTNVSPEPLPVETAAAFSGTLDGTNTESRRIISANTASGP
jgi:hypothetical protein